MTGEARGQAAPPPAPPPADPSLAARLAALHAACFALPPPWRAAEFAAMLQGAHVFLIDTPEGFALGRAAGGEAELLTLCVDPAARGQGRGRALLAAFEAEARARGAEVAFLEVAEANAPARALYAAAGWAGAGRRRGYYAAPDGTRADALVLTRRF